MGTFDGQVAASGDDGWSHDGGTFDGTAANGNIGKFNLPPQRIYDAWLRFTTVTVPVGATVTNAYISLKAWGSGSDGAGTESNIHLEAADDPAAPTTQADHAGRSRSTGIAWDDYDFPDTTNFYDSPDLTTAVQEVIDRGGWASGQATQVLWDDDGSSVNQSYQPRTYDDSSANAAKLHIEYTEAAGGYATRPRRAS